MLQQREHNHIIDILFVMALLALFAFSGIMLIAIGASVYRSNIDSMDSNYTLRTSYAYVTEKIRRADEAGSVSAGSFHDVPALILSEEIDDISYSTKLYLHEGQLYELLSRDDADLPLSAGTAIFPLRDFLIDDDGTLLTLTLTAEDGRKRTIRMSRKTDDTPLPAMEVKSE